MFGTPHLSELSAKESDSLPKTDTKKNTKMSSQTRFHNSCHRGLASCALALALSAIVTSAVLVQPYNYMLDDSSMLNQYDSSGSLSPFYNDQSAANEHSADKDIVSIIGDSLARMRFARMLEPNNQQQNEQEDSAHGQLSQEMADMIQNEQQHSGKSLSSSMANVLLNVAQAAVDHAAASSAAAADDSKEHEHEQRQAAPTSDMSVSSRGGSQIMELDTSQSGSSGGSMPSKADLKVGSSQWFNPKETIPVLKISSMGKSVAD